MNTSRATPSSAIQFPALLLLIVAPASAETKMRFTDVTARCGIDFTMTCGRLPSREILEVDGGGVAFIDYDNDGDFDLFFANGATMTDPENGPGCRLYENNGDATFVDVTERRGVNLKRWAMGAAIGDYNGDRRDDLYVTCYGPDVLLRNDCQPDGGGGFTDVTAQAGLGDPRWSTSAAFGDIDGDDDLDLYVANYLVFDTKNPPDRAGKMFKGVPVMAGPAGLTPQADVLYRNRGDGTFEDVTEACHAVPENPGYGLVVLMFDADSDGKQDIFVGNDSTQNFLFHNQGGCRFEEIGMMSGIAANMDGAFQATMGIALADVDGNGRPDAFTTAFSSDSKTLHLNLDGQYFDDRTPQYGLGMVTHPFLSWGAGFYDFDSDGDEDLYVANGHVYPEAATHRIDSDYEQPQLLMERGSGTRFERVTDAGEFFKTPLRGRAVAFGDLDGDGDVDIVQTTLNDRVRVLRNDAALVGAVAVSLRQKSANYRAYGSRVELLAPGGATQRRWITGGGSYQSTDAPVAYFGLGTSPPPTVTLRVTWPDGTVSEHRDVAVNHRVTLHRTGDSPEVFPLRGRSEPPR